MSKQDSLRTQNCILKVTIDCNGCAQKVKKRLKKIQGVNSVSVDAEQGKVVVTGDKVDPSKLIKKLKSSGMHAELLNGGQQKDMNLSNQFQNFQISSNSIKGEKDNKSKKMVHDFKLPQKAQKSVKFNLKEEKFDASDDGHDDLEEYSDDDEEEEERYGHGHAIPMMRNGVGPGGPTGMMNGPNHKGNNGHGKNGHVIDPTMVIKGKSGNRTLNNNAKKGYKVEKQKNEDQSDNENNEKVKYMVGGGEGDGIKKKNAKSSGGGLVGRFLRFGKKSKKGADDNYNYNYKNIDIKEEKGDGKLDGGGKSKNDKGNNGNMGQVGPIGMNYPIDIRAVQKHPPMNGGGGYQHPKGVQMQMQMQPPSYNQQQQQQYMAVMMNQQHQQQQHQQQYQQQGYMNNMYPQAMMYGRQQPSMNYMPPPPPMPVHPMNDPMTHTFSDENVESCTMM